MLLCISTVRLPDGSMKVELSMKIAERRTKERAHREEHEGWAGRVKNFQKLATLKTASLDCERKQPESEEARPVTPGERAARSGGCPGVKRSRREE